MIREKLYRERIEYYGKKAVLIQKIWRGFFTRKYVHNFYVLKKYLKEVQEKNEIVLKDLKLYEKQQQEKLHQKKLQQIQIEESLRRGSPPRIAKKSAIDENENLRLFQSSKMPVYLPELDPYSEGFSRHRSEPSLSHNQKKIQVKGPFQSRERVFYLRHRLPNPSLRVSTFYSSNKEKSFLEKEKDAFHQICDQRFVNSALPVYIYPKTLESEIPYKEGTGYGFGR
eukprot:Sdes_comp19894_c0_seq4m12239